jgi:hypothetical protein
MHDPDSWFDNILWSDEIWVNGAKHKRTYVTRRTGEAYDDTCIADKKQRYPGWMFWGSFSVAHGKGPAIVWLKEWGSIKSESYRLHIVPFVEQFMRDAWASQPNRDIIFQQDNAPSHNAIATRNDLA